MRRAGNNWLIEISLRVDQSSAPTATKGRAWIATTVLDGAQVQARSHNGASYALARQLVAAGVPDQPVRVSQDGIAGHIAWPSLHKHAGRTIAESATHPISGKRYTPHPRSIRPVPPPQLCA